MSARSAVDGINLRSVALPVEHGGWGMLGEPLAPGPARRPVLGRLGSGSGGPRRASLPTIPRSSSSQTGAGASAHRRTTVALGFVVLYGSAAAVGLGVAAGGQPGWWLPLAAAAPLALAQLAYDARLQGRQLLPELLGAVALGSVVAAEMRAGGPARAARRSRRGPCSRPRRWAPFSTCARGFATTAAWPPTARRRGLTRWSPPPRAHPGPRGLRARGWPSRPSAFSWPAPPTGCPLAPARPSAGSRNPGDGLRLRLRPSGCHRLHVLLTGCPRRRPRPVRSASRRLERAIRPFLDPYDQGHTRVQRTLLP